MLRGAPKKNWSMTSAAFHHLLDWLDEGQNSEGQNYLAIRQKLVVYFDHKNCLSPDELADETLNRVARRLQEEGKIETDAPAKYCYITARFVFLEYLREGGKNSVSLDEANQSIKLSDDSTKQEENSRREKLLDCLEKCALKLEPANREIIISYYYGAERIKIDNRRKLAEKLGISSNALSIRACRIREKLEICVRACASED